jgi:hypothetical protein
MNCPNCDSPSYEVGILCNGCQYYEPPEYWDLGWKAVYVEPHNWAVVFNGRVVEAEFASRRDAVDTAMAWDEEMYTNTIGGINVGRP